MSPVGIRRMIAAGGRALRERPGVVATIYAVQLTVALLYAWGVARALTVLYGRSPLFDRGVDGDLVALVLALEHHAGAVTAMIWIGLAIALAYGALSLYLTAGLLGALAGGSFGEAAGRWFFPFVRVWLWSLVPYAIAFVFLAFGAGVALAGVDLEAAITPASLFGPPLLGALPGLILVAITACAVDYARAILVATGERGATRAILGGFRLVFTRRWPLAHYLVYLCVWGAISTAYVALTFGVGWGVVALFAFRQLTALLRLSARVATSGGQLALVRARYAPNA